MYTIHYSRQGSDHYVLAEQNEDRSWSVDGLGDEISPLEFRALYTDVPSRRYQFHGEPYEDAPDPNILVRAGTHELRECTTQQEVRQLEEMNMGIQFFSPVHGFVHRGQPVYFAKEGPIEPGEEIPLVGEMLPLVAIVPIVSSSE